MSDTNEPQPTESDAVGAPDVTEEPGPISTQPAEDTAPTPQTTPEPAAEGATEETAAEDTAAEDTAAEDTAEEPGPVSTELADEPPAGPAPTATPAPIPKPSAVPTPAALAKAGPRPTAPAAPAPILTDHSASAAFGRVDENGTVFVRTKEGEKEVGSYPGATADEALTYFARKYDELYASAVLLEQPARELCLYPPSTAASRA